MPSRSLLIAFVVIGCRARSDDAQRATPTETARPAASAGRPAPTAATTPIDPPAADGAMAPQLRGDRDGVLATWLEPDGNGHRLVWSRWAAGAWSRPQLVHASPAILANWADVPSVARGNDGVLVAHWAEKREGGKYAYDAVIARSPDGVAWERLGALHDDGTPTEHGFVSLVPDGASIRAFWLDGRATATGGAMTLRTATIGERIDASEVVDHRVCDCCNTAAAATQAGPLVAYRDRSPDEIRDIAIARSNAKTWAQVAVSPDDWKLEGCPVNGPAVASAGEQVVLAWYTFAGEVHRVRAAFSADGGRTFAAPIEVATGSGDHALLGRVGVVLDSDGTAIVSSVAARPRGAAVVLRRVSATGVVGGELEVASTSADRDAGFPRLARDGSAAIVMWTETSSPKRVRAIRMAASHVPAVAGR